MKFFIFSGRVDVDFFKVFLVKDIGFKCWNDEGDFCVNVFYWDYDNIVDFVFGFVLVGGDVDRGMGYKKIRFLVQLNDVLQCVVFQSKYLDRKNFEKVFFEFRCFNIYELGVLLFWNSRKIFDEWIKFQLGGIDIVVLNDYL